MIIIDVFDFAFYCTCKVLVGACKLCVSAVRSCTKLGWMLYKHLSDKA